MMTVVDIENSGPPKIGHPLIDAEHRLLFNILSAGIQATHPEVSAYYVNSFRSELKTHFKTEIDLMNSIDGIPPNEKNQHVEDHVKILSLAKEVEKDVNAGNVKQIEKLWEYFLSHLVHYDVNLIRYLKGSIN